MCNYAKQISPKDAKEALVRQNFVRYIELSSK